MNNKQNLVNSYLMIRTILGVLGIAMPFILWIVYGQLLDSISDYYYSKSSIFLSSILTCFGIFLICYKGHPKKPGELLSDNFITHLGGAMSLMVVFLPMTFTPCEPNYPNCFNELAYGYPLLVHNNPIVGKLHLICAALFLISMGYMSFVQFPKGNKTIDNFIYKLCGIIIWASIGILILQFAIEAIKGLKGYSLFPYSTFVFETIAVVAFGVSWLIKGGTIQQLFKRIVQVDKNAEN